MCATLKEKKKGALLLVYFDDDVKDELSWESHALCLGEICYSLITQIGNAAGLERKIILSMIQRMELEMYTLLIRSELTNAVASVIMG